MSRFSPRLIELAKQFKSGGVPWDPQPGQYVLDEHGVVDRSSPFQTGVYFVLNYQHFMQLAGGVEAFREKMTWLPTWEHARELLRGVGISDAELQRELVTRNAIAQGNELETLYELLAAHYSPARHAAKQVNQ
jgi:hypothetical protein